MSEYAGFDQLDAAGRLDFHSGAWDYPTNQRRARCGRCGRSVPAFHGRPYNQFMSDGYRATTRYLCSGCADSLKAVPA